MGISDEQLRASLDAVAAAEPAFAAALARIGYPEPRISQRGYVTLLRAIVGQQVSIKAAAAIWATCGRRGGRRGRSGEAGRRQRRGRCAPPACHG
jgi:3-methyladenine DNA glycosylase/8-oxoguanine DNA glycosylase